MNATQLRLGLKPASGEQDRPMRLTLLSGVY
jgi:hypothetical protein